jgi:hypothetical protein
MLGSIRFSLNGADAGRDSWQIPAYGSLELHLGRVFQSGKKCTD